MNHTKQTSFILYHDFEPMLQLLSMEQRGMLITAIFDYSVRGMKTEDLPDVVNMAFCCIQRALERDAIAYEEKCRINAENGKKGGAPKGNTNARKKTTINNPIQPNSTQNNLYDNEYENDYENFYDNECVYEFDTDTDTDTDTGTVY